MSLDTFQRWPPSSCCAVVLKNIEITERDQLVDKVANLSESILSQLHELTSLNIAGGGIGFLYGIELVADKQTKEPLSDKRMAQTKAACEEKGLYFALGRKCHSLGSTTRLYRK